VKLPAEPNGLLMEHLLAYVLGLELVKDDRQFTHDADLVSPETGLLWSVKYQKTAARTGNISFETQLINSANGATMPGNFTKNATEKYLVVVPEPDLSHFTALEFDSKELHQFVTNFKGRMVRLTGAVKGTNVGRTYDDAENKLVPISRLGPLVKARHILSYHIMKENPAVLDFLKRTGFGKRKR
jgi:hypothetical protein